MLLVLDPPGQSRCWEVVRPGVAQGPTIRLRNSGEREVVDESRAGWGPGRPPKAGAVRSQLAQVLDPGQFPLFLESEGQLGSRMWKVNVWCKLGVLGP